MNPARRQAILVLGMHRSGTSALAGALVLAGGVPPLNCMPATDDNPRGYWESLRIAQFNNALLETAGVRWKDPANIGGDWFAAPKREEDAARAAELVHAEFGGTGTIVCKDPRICRLLPVWKRAFELMDVECRPVFVLRNPMDATSSLCRRAADPRYRPAAAGSPEEGLLLWLRYNLDAESHSRGMRRIVFDYESLLADWSSALEPLFAEGVLPRPSAEAGGRIGEFLDPRLNRTGAEEAAPPSVGWKVARAVRGAIASGDVEFLEKIQRHFDGLVPGGPSDAVSVLRQLDESGEAL